jgi:DNA polymerase-4
MPSTAAAPNCAELVFVPARFGVYRKVSKQIQAIFKDYIPLVAKKGRDALRSSEAHL